MCSKILTCFVTKRSHQDTQRCTWKTHASLDAGRLKEATRIFLHFQIASSMVKKILVNAHSCHFEEVYIYTPSMEVQECPVLEVQRGHTHRHFSKPFTVNLLKGEGQLYIYNVPCNLQITLCKRKIHVHRMCADLQIVQY